MLLIAEPAVPVFFFSCAFFLEFIINLPPICLIFCAWIPLLCAYKRYLPYLQHFHSVSSWSFLPFATVANCLFSRRCAYPGSFPWLFQWSPLSWILMASLLVSPLFLFLEEHLKVSYIYWILTCLKMSFFLSL